MIVFQELSDIPGVYKTKIQLSLLDLPPPDQLHDYHALGLLGIDLGNVFILIDLPSKHYARSWTGRKSKPVRYPYHGRYLTLYATTRQEYDANPFSRTFLLWNRALKRFDQYAPPVKKAVNTMPTTKASPSKRTVAKSTTSNDNATAAVAKTVAKTKSNRKPSELDMSPLLSQVVTEYKPDDGQKRQIGFLPLSVENMIEWLKHNPHNRPINWGHIWTLCKSWREDWVPEANLYVMDYEGHVADGQHRPIAFVLAFGNFDQVSRLLKLIDSWPTSGWKLPAKGIVAAERLPVPINEWEPWDKGEPVGLYLPVLFNADPRVAEKADTDQKKRTGADQLARHVDTGNMLSRWGLDPNELQQILRYMQLRVLPVVHDSKKDAKTQPKYGSLRKGGNFHPDRYPVLARHFQKYIEQAMEIVHDPKETSYNVLANCPIAHHQVIGNVALALQGEVSEERIRAWLKAWAPVKVDPITGETHALEHKNTAKVVTDAVRSKEDSKLLTPYHRAYVCSRYLNASNPNPACANLDALLKTLGNADFEQQSGNRLPGWDSEGCKEVASDALLKKIKKAAGLSREWKRKS